MLICYLYIYKTYLKKYTYYRTRSFFFNNQCLNYSNISYNLILYPEMLTFNIGNKRPKALAITWVPQLLDWPVGGSHFCILSFILRSLFWSLNPNPRCDVSDRYHCLSLFNVWKTSKHLFTRGWDKGVGVGQESKKSRINELSIA